MVPGRENTIVVILCRWRKAAITWNYLPEGNFLPDAWMNFMDSTNDKLRLGEQQHNVCHIDIPQFPIRCPRELMMGERRFWTFTARVPGGTFVGKRPYIPCGLLQADNISGVWLTTRKQRCLRSPGTLWILLRL